MTVIRGPHVLPWECPEIIMPQNFPTIMIWEGKWKRNKASEPQHSVKMFYCMLDKITAENGSTVNQSLRHASSLCSTPLRRMSLGSQWQRFCLQASICDHSPSRHAQTHTHTHTHTQIQIQSCSSILVRILIGIRHSLAPCPNQNHHDKS